MESAPLPLVGDAFLEWLNQLPLFENEREITIESLADGHLIWRICQDRDPKHFAGSLPESKNVTGRWLSRWQNLKHVYKALMQFMTERNGLMSRSDAGVDLKLIAQGGDVEESIKLLKMTLFVVLNSVDNSEFIQAMATIDSSHQVALKSVIMEVSQGAQATIADDTDPQLKYEKKAGQHELYVEQLAATNARLLKEKKDLQRDYADLDVRLERMQEHNSVLQEKLVTAEDRIQQLSIKPDDGSRIYELETQCQQREDHIASQETQISAYQSELETLQGTIHKHRNASEKLQELQDRVDELKTERDSLERKANALDKLRQKLARVQDIERDNQELRARVEELERIHGGGQANDQTRLLEMEISRYKGTLVSIERHLVETQTLKKQYELTATHLREQLEKTQEQHTRDQETIKELMEGGSNSPRANLGSDLENELAGRQKRDNELETLQSKLRVLEHARDDLHEQLLAETSARANAESSYLRLRSGGAVEEFELYSTIPLSSVTDTVNSTSSSSETQDKLKAERQRARELQREKDAFKKKFAEADTLLSMVNKSDLEAMRALKEMNSKELDAKEKELLEAKEIIFNLQNDVDTAKSLYRDAINRQTSEGIGKELRDTLEAIKTSLPGAQGATNAPALSAILENHVQELAASLEDTQTRLAERAKHIETQDQHIAALREEIQQAEGKTAPEVQKATEQAVFKQELDNLRRENKLIASAFYDLQSRLQMNNVSLARRTEQPRSFLNKQRQLVNQATAVRAR